MRYLIARYDAFNSVYFWTLMNEYEYYPDGVWGHKPLADRWAMRMSRWVKQVAQHGHIVAIHNGPREPAFAQRFATDPDAIETIMFQEWGSTDANTGWLAAGLEEQIGRSLKDWGGSALLAEFGYEHYSSPPSIQGHRYCTAEHTRRGAWRGAMCGLGIIHGFENSWGPFQILDQDQTGVTYLQQLNHFFTQVVPFYRLQPAPELLQQSRSELGYRPLILASDDRDLIVVYLPVGGEVHLKFPIERQHQWYWFDPRNGETTPAEMSAMDGWSFAAPKTFDTDQHPHDWVLFGTAHGG